MEYISVPILARSVFFSKRSEELFNKLVLKAANPQVKQYVDKTLRTYIINDYPTNKLHVQKPDDPDWVDKAVSRGDKIYDVDVSPKDETRFLHWVDYLNTLPPATIRGISIKQLEKKVTDWDSKLASAKTKKQVQVTEGVKPIKTYPTGYTWVELTGRDALALEGDKMGHCVGGDDYVKQVANGSTKIYSLRDKKDEPHVTIDYSTYKNIIVQIKGKSNNPPIPKYHEYIIDFVNNELKPKKIDDTDVLRMGLILSEDNAKILSLEDYTGDTIKVPVFDPNMSDSVTKLPNIESNYIALNKASLKSIGSMHSITDSIDIEDCNIGAIQDISSNYGVNITDSKINSINNIECISLSIVDSSVASINIIKCEEEATIGGNVKSIKQLQANRLDVDARIFGKGTEFHIDDYVAFIGNTAYVGSNSEINTVYLRDVRTLFEIEDNASIEKLTIYKLPQSIKIGHNVSIETLNIVSEIKDDSNMIAELKKAAVKHYKTKQPQLFS